MIGTPTRESTMLRWTSDAERGRGVRIRDFTGDVSTAHFANCLQHLGKVSIYERDTEIFGEEEPADYLYKVMSGAVRVLRLMSDGRRQICGFYFAGAVFGLDFGRTHRFA